MRKNKDNLVYVKHIRDAIDKIAEYTTKYNHQEFISNEWDQAAVIRYFEIIGEATKNIDSSFKKNHSEVEWLDMSDFRNFLIHDYIDVDPEVIWKAMTVDIPLLKDKIRQLL